MKRSDLKFICLSLLMAGAGMFIAACSSEDEDPVKQTTRDGSDTDTVVSDADSVVLDADTLKVFDDYSVKFQLLNSNNQPVTTFKEGENFTFQMTIINPGDDYLSLPIEMLNMLYFDIYTDDDTYLGRPYDGVSVFGMDPSWILPHESLAFTCKAFGERDWDTGNDTPDIQLLKINDREPLPKGKYYTEFTLKFENYSKYKESIEFKKEFTIE